MTIGRFEIRALLLHCIKGSRDFGTYPTIWQSLCDTSRWRGYRLIIYNIHQINHAAIKARTADIQQ
jgi:hypothetical protein